MEDLRKRNAESAEEWSEFIKAITDTLEGRIKTLRLKDRPFKMGTICL